MPKFIVTIKEITTRPVIIEADTPAEAERIAEESYMKSDVSSVDFDAQHC